MGHGALFSSAQCLDLLFDFCVAPNEPFSMRVECEFLPFVRSFVRILAVDLLCFRRDCGFVWVLFFVCFVGA